MTEIDHIDRLRNVHWRLINSGKASAADLKVISDAAVEIKRLHEVISTLDSEWQRAAWRQD